MPRGPRQSQYNFEISLSVLNHLGRNLYRNFITVLAEAISNSWDADAKNVWITIEKDSSFFWIADDGVGMSANDFQNRFLKIGYSKRKGGKIRSPKERPYIGAKGIGKLALLSCAQRVTVVSRKSRADYVGGTIDNSGLDAAIVDDLTPGEYPLEPPADWLLSMVDQKQRSGTYIFFEEMKESIRHSIPHIKKLLAMSFQFSTISDDFTIYVNGEAVDASDLQDVSENTEFAWIVNRYADDYTRTFSQLKAAPRHMVSKLDFRGYLATVTKPRYLKVSGTDERATIDLFVNGRLREKNILRHVPTQRIVESYLYGQLHFDRMDSGTKDPFTSSREGIIEDDPDFQALLQVLRSQVLPKVIDEWDKLRLDRGEEGDDENPRKSRKERKITEAVSAAKEEYVPDSEASDEVGQWLEELTPDAEYNVSSYVDCFLSENLVRRYIDESQVALPKGVQKTANDWRKREDEKLEEANLSFDVRRDTSDLSYLGLDELAVTAEGGKKLTAEGKPVPLWTDAIGYRPVRNVIGHTGVLTENAKKHLNLRFENIKARLRKLLEKVG